LYLSLIFLVVHSLISLLLTGFYIAVLAYFCIGWKRLKKPGFKPGDNHTKVSILIAARNEEEHIGFTIDDILAQNYPSELFELIIVDDNSSDNTAEIVASYASRGVKLLRLNEETPLNSYKKKAISEAIKMAQGDLIVATDADCRMGANWLKSIVDYYEAHDFYIISAPVAYTGEKSLFERLQTLEFAFLIGIGASSIGNKKASTCNGANLTYQKSVFYAVGGFKGIDDLASGDDELLLQKIAEKFPGHVGFLKMEEAVVYTKAKPNLKEFIQQRRRWASKSTKYKDKKVVLLAVMIWLFNITLLLNLILSVLSSHFFYLFIIQLGAKYLMEIIFLGPILSFFKRKELIRMVSFLSPLHTLYLVYIGIMGNGKKYMWKGRLVK
jgi:cellulose synthase/poly-beta-1,6-N-acetylglucosamine synthase-like glycosyltransferase